MYADVIPAHTECAQCEKRNTSTFIFIVVLRCRQTRDVIETKQRRGTNAVFSIYNMKRTKTANIWSRRCHGSGRGNCRHRRSTTTSVEDTAVNYMRYRIFTWRYVITSLFDMLIRLIRLSATSRFEISP